MTKPALRPGRPYFSSGPCAKRPGWTPEILSSAVLGLVHGLAIGSTIYLHPRRAARRSGARIPPLTSTTGGYSEARRRDRVHNGTSGPASAV